MYHVKPLRVLTPKSVQKMKTEENVEAGEVPATLSVHFSNGVFKELDELLTFNCKKVTYVWDEEKREFCKLKGLDQGVSTDVLHKCKGLTLNEHFMR